MLLVNLLKDQQAAAQADIGAGLLQDNLAVLVVAHMVILMAYILLVQEHQDKAILVV